MYFATAETGTYSHATIDSFKNSCEMQGSSTCESDRRLAVKLTPAVETYAQVCGVGVAGDDHGTARPAALRREARGGRRGGPGRQGPNLVELPEPSVKLAQPDSAPPLSFLGCLSG